LHRSANHIRGSLLARWGRFAARHRWPVLICWAVILVSLAAFSFVAGGRFVNNYTVPATESQDAATLLEDRFPEQYATDSATLVFKAEDGVRDERIRRRIEDILAEARKLPEVTSVISPFQTPGTISRNGQIAYATLQYDKPASEVDQESFNELVKFADESPGRGLTVEVGGRVISANETSPPRTSEVVGLTAASVILLIAFGSVVAMGMPVITALVGLSCSFSLIMLVARLLDISTFTPAFAAMVSLGVGIDYALFVVTRYREGLSAGLGVEDAIALGLDTAGRAVMMAGIVVVVALLTLTTMGIPFVTAISVVLAIAVALTVIVALTLLPALLGFVGGRVDRWRIPGVWIADEGNRQSTAGYRLSCAVQRHPLLYAFGATVLLLLLTVPILDLQLGFSDDGNKPTSFNGRRAYDLLSEGFGPGINGPLFVVVNEPKTLDSTLLTTLRTNLDRAGHVESVAPPVPSERRDTAFIIVIPSTSPQDKGTTDLVEDLRKNVVPQALKGSDATAYVGGATAALIDIQTQMENRIPLFFALVIGLSFLLLTAVFRSILVPVKAAIMNLLSIGAAYGVLVPIFQWGWGNDLLGIAKAGPIEPFFPILLFAAIFGLSMDYEVFLVSRIRESYLKSGDARASVVEGLASTARIITAAAAIMIFVFFSFILSEDRIIKEFGIGLAIPILIDATVIRLVLVPSTMTLLGRYNWVFPRWLDATIPNLNIEGKSRLLYPVPVGERPHYDEREEEEVGHAPDATAEMQPDEARVSSVVGSVVVRVSGTPGTVYSGAYGTIEEGQSVDAAIVEAEPTDYEVKAEGGVLDAVAAAFRKIQSDDWGTLRAQILIDGEVVDQEETLTEFGVVNVSWSPQTGPMERTAPSH
jgi:RND superfamily putative drug exporter